MITLKELKEIVNTVEKLADGKKTPDKIEVKLRTFDDQFEEQADEFQRPNEITGVDVDVKNWDKVTITIERNTKHEKMQF